MTRPVESERDPAGTEGGGIPPEAVIPLAASGNGRAPHALRGVLILMGVLVWIVTLTNVGFTLYMSLERNENRLLLERLDSVGDDPAAWSHEGEREKIRHDLDEIRDELQGRTGPGNIEFFAGMVAIMLVIAVSGVMVYILKIRLPKKYPELWEKR